MEAIVLPCSQTLTHTTNINRKILTNYPKPTVLLNVNNHPMKSVRTLTMRRTAGMDDGVVVMSTTDPGQVVGVSWQVVVGTIAGVTPFVVAAIEFSKRIIAQRRCKECKGSGLIKMDKDYCRCPECGGFLPWQSWRRFFFG